MASSVFLAGETGVQSAKNAAATSSNWKQLQQDVQSDDRQQELLRLILQTYAGMTGVFFSAACSVPESWLQAS